MSKSRKRNSKAKNKAKRLSDKDANKIKHNIGRSILQFDKKLSKSLKRARKHNVNKLTIVCPICKEKNISSWDFFKQYEDELGLFTVKDKYQGLDFLVCTTCSNGFDIIMQTNETSTTMLFANV